MAWRRRRPRPRVALYAERHAANGSAMRLRRRRPSSKRAARAAWRFRCYSRTAAKATGRIGKEAKRPSFLQIAFMYPKLCQRVIQQTARVAERSKALRSGRSLPLKAWVRIPPLAEQLKLLARCQYFFVFRSGCSGMTWTLSPTSYRHTMHSTAVAHTVLYCTCTINST